MRPGIFGLAQAVEDAAAVLLPVPWEATTSYRRGTAGAPDAIFAASAQVDLFDVVHGDVLAPGVAMLSPEPEVLQRAQLASLEAMTLIDAYERGQAPDVDALARVNAHSTWLNHWLQEAVEGWLARDKLVGVIGGDHSVAFGSIAACAGRHPGLGILQIDAHADLRIAYQGFVDSHASVMHRVLAALPQVVRLVSVGVRDLCAQEHRAIVASEGRVVAHFDEAIARQLAAGVPFGQLADQLVSALPQQVYISFDIDGLDPSLCPNTGTPVPGGLSFHQVQTIFEALVASGRTIVGFDICEVAPGSGGDEWDANVGARILFKLLAAAFRSRA